jgi:HPt (histidine-containing phosphotransfer) domain-containing protein
MSSHQPIDLKHLDSYTGGDRALNEEVLRLFDDHCRSMLAQLEGDSGDKQRWRHATHTLKGAARGVGAFELAEAAAAAEKTLPDDTAAILAAITRIKNESATVHRFIEEFLAQGS